MQQNVDPFLMGVVCGAGCVFLGYAVGAGIAWVWMGMIDWVDDRR